MTSIIRVAIVAVLAIAIVTLAGCATGGHYRGCDPTDPYEEC